MNSNASLEAAHEALSSFFLLWELFWDEAQVWWVFNHRAFLEAMCIGKILQGQGKESLARDPVFVRGRADIVHMIDIITQMSESEPGQFVAKTRAGVLSQFL